MINTDNYELYFFQYQERMLNEKERHEVEVFAQAHPELAEELALYAESPKLSAEEVCFTNKDSLKRKEPLALWWRYAAAACAVTVLITMAILHIPHRVTESNGPMIAQQSLPINTNCPSYAMTPPSEQTHSTIQLHKNVKSEPIQESNEQMSEMPMAVEQVIDDDALAANATTLEMINEGEVLAYHWNISIDTIDYRKPRTIIPEVIDYTETSWSTLLIYMISAQYPERSSELTEITKKTSDWSSRIRKNKVINYIISIV